VWYICTRNSKLRCYVHHYNHEKVSELERGAIFLLDQWRQIHICCVHVDHQPRDVIHGERYAVTRNTQKFPSEWEKHILVFQTGPVNGKIWGGWSSGNLKSSSRRKELMSSCTDGLLDPPIILARMLETTCSFDHSVRQLMNDATC
jgi:hypothetical protein